MSEDRSRSSEPGRAAVATVARASGSQRGSAVDGLASEVVSIPLKFGQARPGGVWAEWCAERRASALPAGVGWDDPGLVIDLTGPVPTVSMPPLARRGRAAAYGMVPARLVAAAALAIVVLNVLDVITTRFAISRGATEGNPLASLFVSHLPIFVVIKVLFPAFVALRMWVTRTRTTPGLLAAMYWVVGVYSMAIVINALHLL